MKFALALLIAVHFWGERNVHIPCHPVAIAGADAMLPVDLYGYPIPMAANGCRIEISTIGAELRKSFPMMYCADVVHEVGHVGGLAHTSRGIMRPELSYTNAPYDCAHWRSFERRLRAGLIRPGPGEY